MAGFAALSVLSFLAPAVVSRTIGKNRLRRGRPDIAALSIHVSHHACLALSTLPMRRPGLPVSMKSAREVSSASPGPNSSPKVWTCIPQI